jgi:8-oxo-dGTP diphosphatase
MNNPRVGVACFVWKNGMFLMGQRKGSHGNDTWSVPGGHLDPGESWEACAKREVREETGLEIKNVRLFAVTNDLFHADNKHYISIWMEADWEGGEPQILEPTKFISQKWATFDTLPKPLFQPCWHNLQSLKPNLFN